MEGILLEAFLLGLLVGAGGTLIGAGAAMLIRHPGRRLSGVLLGLAGGIMLAVSVFDMLPEAWEEGGPWPTVAGLAVGLAVLYYISRKTHHEHLHDADGVEPQLVQQHQLRRTGLLLALGMSIHNLPQGLAIGTGVAADFAWSLSLLLMLHNIPEGMAMALPLKVGHVKPARILTIAALTAVPTIGGALVGALLSEISGAFISGCLAFSAGAMIYITVSELIPQAANLGSRAALLLSAAVGAGIGVLFIWLFG